MTEENIMSFELAAAVRDTDKFYEEVATVSADWLDTALRVNLSDFDGNGLQELRDTILTMQNLAEVSRPDNLKRIKDRAMELNRDLTLEEVDEVMNYRPYVTFNVEWKASSR